MSIDMRDFLKKFNMRKMYKNINIALIFMLIGVFFWPDYAYPANISYLRVPVGRKSTYGRVLNELSRTGKELSARKRPVLVDSWYRKLGLHDKIMQSENPNRNIAFNPLEVDISEGALQRQRLITATISKQSRRHPPNLPNYYYHPCKRIIIRKDTSP